jgi:hypothetical protein
MKKLLVSISGLLFAFALGCNSDAGNSGAGLLGLAGAGKGGTVSFAFDQQNAPSALMSIAGPGNAPNVTAVVVTIQDALGNVVYNMKSIPLVSFGGQYISQPLTLPVGSYHLTQFLAVNSSGTALYATPVEGSAVAYLVSDPLPIDFSIAKNQVSKLVPEVLSTETFTPADFGYATFSFDIVDTIDFLVGVLAYNESSSNYEMTTADISVTSGATSLYTGTLPAATTAVKVRDGYSTYTVTVTRAGYADFTQTFTAAELGGYALTPLVVTLGTSDAPEMHTIITTEYNASDNSVANKSYSHCSLDQYEYDSKDDTSFMSFIFGLGMLTGHFIKDIDNEMYISISAGSNGIWLDSDDTLILRFVQNNTHDSMDMFATMDPGSMTGYILPPENEAGYVTGMNFHQAGTDGLFYTADDTGSFEGNYTLDSENRIIAVAGMPRYEIQYSGQNIVKVIAYTGGGSSIGNVRTTQYDVNNRPVSMRYYSDDEVTQIGRASVEYNGAGRISKLMFYNGAGSDGIWGNGDDVIGVFSTGTNYSGYAYGQPFIVGYGFASPLPVAAYEYDEYGVNIRTNGYSDNGTTLVRYSILEYN